MLRQNEPSNGTFSVQATEPIPQYLHQFPFLKFQTLYKTQVRELKEECEEKAKLGKDIQQKMQELQDERCEFGCLILGHAR